jgi:hypothetical protein
MKSSLAIQKALASAKPTRATFSRFVTSALEAGTLHVAVSSQYDGMVDGITQCEKHAPRPAQAVEGFAEHTMGVGGIWLVGRGRDYFTRVDRDGFAGFNFSNCCGSGFVGVPA